MTTERRGKGRALSDDEIALWRGVAASVEPLKRIRKRRKAASGALTGAPAEPNAVPAPASAAPPAKSVAPPGPQPKAKKAPVLQPTKLVVPVKTKVTKKPPLADFEARAARKLAAGKIEIDARIDLHGLRQDEARLALRRFLVVAQQRGYRHVKVITGKGRPVNDTAAFDLFDERRGVLRQSVPEWLSAPDLRDIVVSYTAAGRSHGGDGALYVRLRRAK
jgi:DNA-nicking Smr family endonuclease